MAKMADTVKESMCLENFAQDASQCSKNWNPGQQCVASTLSITRRCRVAIFWISEEKGDIEGVDQLAD